MAKAKATTTKKNTSNAATQKANSATMAARYSTPSTSASKSTNTSATKNTTSSSLGRAVSNAVKTATNAASSAVSNINNTNNNSLGSSVSNAIKTATNAVSNSVPAGAGSSSTSSSVNKATSPGTVKYNNTVQETANAQKAARESYVNNLLSQLKNQGGVSGMLNANTNPNMTPGQRTNAMLSTIGKLVPAVGAASAATTTNGAKSLLQTLANDHIVENRNPEITLDDYLGYGVDLVSSSNPVASLAESIGGDVLRQSLADKQQRQQEQYDSMLAMADRYRPTSNNAMEGDARYVNQYPNAMQGDARYQPNYGNAMEGDPRYQAPVIDNRPTLDWQYQPHAIEGLQTNIGESLQNALTGAGRSLVDTVTADPETLAARAVVRNLGESASQVPTRLTDAITNAFANAGNLADGSNGGSGSKSTSTRTSSYSRSGSGSGAALGDGSIDISTLYDLLNQRLGEYDANFDEMMNALMDNYNMNFQSLEDAYAAALNRLGSNYSDTEALLNSSLANSQRSLEDDRTRALQEAYIARMMQEKNLADQLDAYGLSGGATESVLADMRNNYNNNRNSIEAKVQESLRDLLQQYMTNLSDARGRYNDSLLGAETNRLNAIQNLANSMSQAENNIINQRSNARAGAYEDLYNTLANLTMKGINYV